MKLLKYRYPAIVLSLFKNLYKAPLIESTTFLFGHKLIFKLTDAYFVYTMIFY